MVIATVCAANVIPLMLAPKIPQGEKEESKMNSQDTVEEKGMTQENYSEEGYSEYKGTNRNCTDYHEFQGEKSKNEGDTILKSAVADEGNPDMEENGTKSKTPPP